MLRLLESRMGGDRGSHDVGINSSMDAGIVFATWTSSLAIVHHTQIVGNADGDIMLVALTRPRVAIREREE